MTQTNKLKAGWLSLGLLSAAGVGALGYGWGNQGATAQQREAPSAQHKEVAVERANDLSVAFRSAADHVLPAVVAIQHRMDTKVAGNDGPTLRGRGQMPRGLENLPPQFRKFFEDGFPGMDGMDGSDDSGHGSSSPRMSSGSGVIIDKSGIVLTNNHVVAGGGKITVKLHDGREFNAVDVKTDPSTDIAVLRIESSEPLPYASLADSDEMQIGDWVLACGQPFGLQDTVTAGIISAKGRSIGIVRDEEFLQTDAAINPGNSGGPLVNLHGDVVGINTAISSSSGGYQGVGFAVPANVAKWVSGQLLKDGTVHRAYLGVGIQPVSAELKEQFELNTLSGAVVTDVQAGSPAEAGGIKPQDVIVSFGGRPITSHRALSNAVARSPLDSKQPVVVVRDGKEVKLTVTVREQPANFGVRAGANGDNEDHEQKAQPQTFNKLGMQVGALTGDVAKQLGLDRTGGVVVTAVEPGSVAANAGLEAGDVIAQVGRKSVTSVDEFDAAVGKASLEKGVLLLVKSAEGSRFVVLKAE